MPTSSAPNTKAVGPWRFASYKPESAWSFFPPIHLKNMNVKLDHFRRVPSWWFFPPIHHETYERQNGWTSSPFFFRGEHSKTYLSCYHPVIHSSLPQKNKSDPFENGNPYSTPLKFNIGKVLFQASVIRGYVKLREGIDWWATSPRC